MSLLTLAQDANQLIGDGGMAELGVGLGFGLTVLGGGLGIGRIGQGAVESIARQPESSGTIGTNMIIAAALIEGLAVISMVLLAFVVK